MNDFVAALSMRLAAITCILLMLTACSKTLQWEEEVSLNIGQTIWLKRTVVYSLQGGAGNPFDIAYRSEDDEAIEFNWGGKDYYYKGDAVIMVLAISPDNQPVLVAKAADSRWDATHKYACTYPFYVQLMPDATGRVWIWPPQIETWLYNLPANLFREIGVPDGMLSRYTIEQKKRQGYLRDRRLVSAHKIDPAYSGDLCKRKGK